jgi:hypothetical protein
MDKRKQISPPDADLDALEAHLAGTLRPVRPSGDVIARLRERVRLPQREQIVLRLRDWRSLFLAFGSVMSGLLVLITVARAFFHFYSRKSG